MVTQIALYHSRFVTDFACMQILMKILLKLCFLCANENHWIEMYNVTQISTNMELYSVFFI